MTLGDGPADMGTLFARRAGRALTRPAQSLIRRPNALREPSALSPRFQGSMPRLVMKFGGTSVADVERIRNVART